AAVLHRPRAAGVGRDHPHPVGAAVERVGGGLAAVRRIGEGDRGSVGARVHPEGARRGERGLRRGELRGGRSARGNGGGPGRRRTMTPARRSSPPPAFSLVEIIVVTVILAVLAGAI